MKVIKLILGVCLFGIISCQAQTDNKKISAKSEKKEVTTKEINLLDEQTKIFGQVFELGGMGKGNPLVGAKNYLELLDNSYMSTAQKMQLQEMYKVYNLSLDPKKKDSLKVAVNKMLKSALERTQNDQ